MTKFAEIKKLETYSVGGKTYTDYASAQQALADEKLVKALEHSIKAHNGLSNAQIHLSQLQPMFSNLIKNRDFRLAMRQAFMDDIEMEIAMSNNALPPDKEPVKPEIVREAVNEKMEKFTPPASAKEEAPAKKSEQEVPSVHSPTFNDVKEEPANNKDLKIPESEKVPSTAARRGRK